MIDLFMPFRAFLKFENVCTDNNVFRMHYKVTVIMLLVFTLLVTSKQFFGEPIHCMNDNEKDTDKDAVNSYCWIYGTYSLKSRFVGVEGRDMAYPGVGPSKGDNDEQIKHTYYQWVCFVLLGQSVMFYTPRYLWKIWEGGRLKALAADLSSPVTKDCSEFRRGELVSYLSYQRDTNLHTHNMYALRYAFCEILNLLNVVGQIFLLDIFLGGAFRNYGAAVAAFSHTPRVPADMTDFVAANPMDQFFPKLTKCWLRSYGPSGTLQMKDRLCVLPLNIVNEKIFCCRSAPFAR
uniref:Innexin n=1 Tax=Heliothis virescens TaxID=7102 RepID=A0A2A4K4P2_HELVI